MNNKFIDMSNIVSIEDMLSSSSYITPEFDHCVYCNNEVDNVYAYQYDNNLYHPHRCDCRAAQLELNIKEGVLRSLKWLEDLNEFIDIEDINKSILESEIMMAEEYKNSQRRQI